MRNTTQRREATRPWLAIALAALLLTDASAQQTLTIAAFPAVDEIVRAAIPQWKRTHPTVDIKVVSRQFSDHHTAMTTALSTSFYLPDVMALEVGYVGRFAQGGGLEDLSRAPYNIRQFQSRYVPYAFAQATSRKGTVAVAPAAVARRTPLAGTTTIPAGSVIIYSETAAVANFNPFPGWGQATLYSEATVAGNKSLKYTMLNYEGLDWTASPVDVSGKGKVHLDIWSPDITSVKLYLISQNPTVETAVTIPLTAGIWNSVDLDLSSFVGPNKASISQMKFDTPLPGAGTLYVDNIYFWGAASVGGGTNLAGEMGSGGPQTMTVATASLRTPNGGLTFFVNGEGMFAADYVGSAEAFAPFNLAAWPSAHTASYPGTSILAGGSIGYFQDDVGLSNSANKITEGGYVVGSGLDPNGAPNFFRYFVMKGPALPNSYMGLFVNAPNNGTVNVSAFTRIKFRMWGPQKMYESTFHPQGVEVVLAGPKVAGCGTGSGGTEIAQTFNATQTIGAASQYKLLLSGFTVKGTCGSDTAQTAVASVLSQVARVVFAIPGTAFNFTLPELNTNPPEYSMGINLGAIGFTNVP